MIKRINQVKILIIIEKPKSIFLIQITIINIFNIA